MSDIHLDSQVTLEENLTALNQEQKIVLDYIISCNKNNTTCQLIVQGPAGTGKSFLIRTIELLIKQYQKTYICGSHQAIAASNINGFTIYKIFSFPLKRDKASIDILVNEFAKFPIQRHVLTKVKNNFVKKTTYIPPFSSINKTFSQNAENNWLILDELSMISVEMLNDIDSCLKAVFNPNLPFGGINVILFGDLYQLKPVKETALYCLNEDHFIKYFKFFELTINQRQKDEEFYNLCQSIKIGALSSTQKKQLKTRLVKNFDQKIIEETIHLFPIKKKCDNHNLTKICNLHKDKYYFVFAKNNINKDVNLYISEEDQICFNGLYDFLLLAEDTKVMNTVNSGGVVNGQIGIIKSLTVLKKDTQNDLLAELSKERIQYFKSILSQLQNTNPNAEIIYAGVQNIQLSIKLSDIQNTQETIFIEPFPSIEKKIEECIKPNSLSSAKLKIIRSRIMFPLQLAWAVTTHKIQGITLPEAVIDLGNENFEAAQLYINISRVKTFDKLYITHIQLPLIASPYRKKIRAFLKEIKENNEKNLSYDFKQHTVDSSDDDIDFEDMGTRFSNE